ncbi:MAG TPA: response regulator [Planctomycetaceae bacterium]|nr:response regulator [Planctomycetaceae bacterium]
MVARRGKPYQLLIADDDLSFREALREVFRPYVGLLEAESGEEAIRIVRQRRVDVVLLDMHMQRLTGLETLRIVKRIEPRVPCILVTADATPDLRRAAAEAEAFTVLEKPPRVRELVQTVASALQNAYSDSNPIDW